ncbi:hypothetical protein GCM10009760_12860 [Kitasatospora kazusensis]|uniref:Uncharacterized protein n=1 Tax=Kitasatospora kazusensis TaxID=407974 RepID=A0ABP5KNX6_9ACTN
MTDNDSGRSCEVPPAVDTAAALRPAADGPRADCVRCGEPTELPADHPDATTLCPLCAWQQGQRGACSG